MTPAGLWQPRSGPRTFGPPQPWPDALKALHLARRAMGGGWRLQQAKRRRETAT